jgi:CrcB protein
MSALVVLAVGCVGGLGAIPRLVIDAGVSRRVAREFPYGTLVVNLSGAFLLGLLVGLAPNASAYRIAGTGLIGAFTTFSTWSLEGHRLVEDGELRGGLANFAVSLILGVALAWAGRRLGVTL